MQRYLDEFEQERLRKQLWFFRLALLAVCGLVLFRFWQLQVIQGQRWKLIAVENQYRQIRILPSRGMILDRNGRLLAGNKLGFNITVIPADIDDKSIAGLAPLLGLQPEELKQRIKQNQISRYVPAEIAENISWEELSAVEERLRDFSGVDIELRPVRSYPQAELASHVLGYLGEISPEELEQPQYRGYQLGDYIGKAGIERLKEPSLRGTDGFKYKVVDASGRERGQEILPGLKLESEPPLPGSNVTLTLDLELEQLASQELQGKTGAIVMLGAKTGEVLAMASSPAFNPEVFVNPFDPGEWTRLMTDPAHPLYNRAIQGTYPLGSVFKTVLSLAGLSEKFITPETAVRCNGVFHLGKIPFKCWRKNGHGIVSFHRALVESCDVYFYTLGNRLGVDRIAHYANLLGLGLRTGLGLEPESAGLIPSTGWMEKVRKQKWNAGDTISVSIGQGYVLATPLQTAVMAMVVGNEGELFRPRLVKKIAKSDGSGSVEYAPELIQKLQLKEQNWKLLKDALTGVVNEPGGTAYWTARSDLVTIAGKTGTAQVIKAKQFEGIPPEKVPEKYRDHAWFIAFAPADDPKVAVAVLVEHGMHGSSASGPIAKKLIEKYFELYPAELPPRPAKKEKAAEPEKPAAAPEEAVPPKLGPGDE